MKMSTTFTFKPKYFKTATQHTLTSFAFPFGLVLFSVQDWESVRRLWDSLSGFREIWWFSDWRIIYAMIIRLTLDRILKEVFLKGRSSNHSWCKTIVGVTKRTESRSKALSHTDSQWKMFLPQLAFPLITIWWQSLTLANLHYTQNKPLGLQF